MNVSEAVAKIESELPALGWTVAIDSTGWIGACGESSYLSVSNGPVSFSVRVSDHGCGVQKMIDYVCVFADAINVVALVARLNASAEAALVRREEANAIKSAQNAKMIESLKLIVKTGNSKARRDALKKIAFMETFN